MTTNDIHISLGNAFRELQGAEQELNRPQEDVVTLSACRTVRNSMKQMMLLYLAAQGLNARNEDSLETLHSYCSKASRAFEKIDLSHIECRCADHKSCDSKYCLGVDNVADCLTAANEVKTLIWRELKITA